MQVRYLRFLSILLCSFTISAFEIPADYRELKCALIPIPRPPRPDKRKPFVKDEAKHTRPHLPISFGTSTNWAGYVGATNLSTPAPKSVNQISGTWNVPTIFSSDIKTYSSIWVGIDGYSSSTVEQIGTEHDWSNGAQVNYAWFEMYPNYSYLISGFPVIRGDSISAKVAFQGNDSFGLTIANNTRKVYMTIPSSHTKSTTAQRSSVEWIVEAPFMNSILPLAQFSNIAFSNCNATINNILAPIRNNSWVNNALTMVTSNNVVKAQTSALSPDDKGFSVAWKHR